MLYRAESEGGDYQIGVFHRDTPDAVAQAIRTRLRQWRGEWPLDPEEGTPYLDTGLGQRGLLQMNAAIRRRILETPGVSSLLNYASSFDAASRNVSVRAAVSTTYGTVAVEIAL